MDLKARQSFFEKEGYLIVEDLLSAEEVEACQAEIHKLHQFRCRARIRCRKRTGSGCTPPRTT